MAAAVFFSFWFLLCVLIGTASSLKCYKCADDCSKNEIPIVECAWNETHCVTFEINRYSVVRGCLSQTDVEPACSVLAMARKQCQLCNTDACNMHYQEPLICRVCDWTLNTNCPTRRRCHIPFGTHQVQCYIVYSRLRGFNYGCSQEADSDVEMLMNEDIYRIVHIKCDAHDCNDEVKFLPTKHMFDEYRMCYGCDRGLCGYLLCPNTYSQLGMFCYVDRLRHESGCLGNLTTEALAAGFAGKSFLICPTNYCNENMLEADLICNDEEGFGHFCPTKGQQCVSFREDSNDHYTPLGCTYNAPCYDRDRCYFCGKHGCNDKKPDLMYVQCYVCYNQPGCQRIREGQVMYLQNCYSKGCQWSSNGVVQYRSCGPLPTDPEWNQIYQCSEHHCNQVPSTAVCYDCNENSRECIYSQKHMNIVHCQPGVDSCYVNDRGNGRVDRGCGTRDSMTAKNCHNSTLCNGQSTVTHTCHIFETDFDFQMNLEPPVMGTEFVMGWTPAVCSDVDGRPACYMSFNKDGMAWGCMGDLKNFKESFYGAEPSDTFAVCEGHYCNYLP